MVDTLLWPLQKYGFFFFFKVALRIGCDMHVNRSYTRVSRTSKLKVENKKIRLELYILMHRKPSQVLMEEKGFRVLFDRPSNPS